MCEKAARGQCLGALSNSKKLEQRFRALAGFAARPSSDFERPVAAEHARAVISSGMCEKAALGRRFRVLPNTKKPARAAISSAKWLPSTPEKLCQAECVNVALG